MEEKIHEEDMWCFNCEHIWNTKDYFNCDKCPNCDTEPVRLYRTSGTAYFYAYLEKHPEKKPKL
jgi:uncharacterized CHY-type Zn-finger protein